MAKRTCSIEGCDRKHHSRGWCKPHYYRWWRTGHPDGMSNNPVRRFWLRVDQNGPIPAYRPDLGPCWVWTGPLVTGGYAQFYTDGRKVQAHRWLYGQENGPLPKHLHLDHLCRVRHCVRPSHVEPVTQGENNRRGFGFSGQNIRKTHCPHGHEYTRENTRMYKTSRFCRACKREYAA